MKKMMLAAAMAAVTVAPPAAVTVGPAWCVAYPQEGSKEVNSALRVAAEEVADDINEATGLKLNPERDGKGGVQVAPPQVPAISIQASALVQAVGEYGIIPTRYEAFRH